LQINIIGAVAALVLVLVLWLFLVKPKQDAIAVTQASIASTESAGGTADQVQTHQNDLKHTQAEAKRTQDDWNVNSVYYMPELPYKSTGPNPQLISIYEGPESVSDRGFKDLPSIWGRWITNWYDAQQKEGITRVPGVAFPIPAFPPDPNYISTVKQLALPEPGRPWSVAVECKSFQEAMAHLKRFNSIRGHGMPVVNNVSLAGQSPNLMMTYTLGLYIIPSTPPPAEDPRLGGSRVTGGGGGFPGMGGGMSGMPPSMMGSMPGMGGKGGMMPGGMSGAGPAGGASSKSSAAD